MTRLSLAGKLLGPAALLLACLTISAASAYSQAPPPQRNIQIKIVIDGKELDLNDEAVQALLARQKAPQAAQVVPKLNVGRLVWEAVVVDDPRVDQLVRQAEAIKPGAGEAVRKLLVQKRSFDYWIAANKHPAEIEELAKRAEAVAPGSGAKIRMLLAGVQHVNEAPIMPMPGMAVPGISVPFGAPPIVIAPHPEANYADTVKRFFPDAAGTRIVVGAEAPKVPEAKAGTGYYRELAKRSAELDALARQIERINAEVRALRQHIDQANGVAPQPK
jgi:hypothetical protein